MLTGLVDYICASEDTPGNNIFEFMKIVFIS